MKENKPRDEKSTLDHICQQRRIRQNQDFETSYIME